MNEPTPLSVFAEAGASGAQGPRWRKSSFSGTGNCVEIAFTPSGVLVRDTKHRAKATLEFTFAEWTAFAAGIRAGEFDI